MALYARLWDFEDVEVLNVHNFATINNGTKKKFAPFVTSWIHFEHILYNSARC